MIGGDPNANRIFTTDDHPDIELLTGNHEDLNITLPKMVGLGDINGDGFAEWGFSDYGANTFGHWSNSQRWGRLILYKGAPGDADEICLGAPNSLHPDGASLELDGAISVSNNALTLSVINVPDGTGYNFSSAWEITFTQ